MTDIKTHGYIIRSSVTLSESEIEDIKKRMLELVAQSDLPVPVLAKEISLIYGSIQVFKDVTKDQ